MPTRLKLIAGLGNPGPDYSATRHNVGFWFVDRVAEQYQSQFTPDKKFFGELTRLSAPGINCRLFKPSTFMNASGRALQAITGYYNIDCADILIVHDEVDLDVGTIRLKKGGGHGGHNGLRDISEKLGGADYLRLRIGVSHPGDKTGVTAHVLSRPGSEDAGLINAAIQRGMEVLPLLFAGELDKAMTRLHTNPEPDGQGRNRFETRPCHDLAGDLK